MALKGVKVVYFNLGLYEDLNISQIEIIGLTNKCLCWQTHVFLKTTSKQIKDMLQY